MGTFFGLCSFFLRTGATVGPPHLRVSPNEPGFKPRGRLYSGSVSRGPASRSGLRCKAFDQASCWKTSPWHWALVWFICFARERHLAWIRPSFFAARTRSVDSAALRDRLKHHI